MYLRDHLGSDIRTVDQKCFEAKIEENDYTVFTVDDLQWELELAEAAVKKKMSFIDHQVSLHTP